MKLTNCMLAKNNRLKCNISPCDGGVKCWEDNMPEKNICKKCLCSLCLHGKCEGKERSGGGYTKMRKEKLS